MKDRDRQLTLLLLLLTLVPALTLYWQNRDIPQFGWLQDDALYVNTAKAVVTGDGYRLTFLPGEPYMNKYPPVYPLILAALWKINPNFPGNLSLFVAWNLLPLIAMVAGLWRLYLKFDFSRQVAAGLTFAYGCVPILIFLACSAMTECTFLALFFWTFVFLEEETVGSAAIAGVLAAFCYLTRTAASPLLLTAVVCLLLRRKFKPAIAFAAAAVPLPLLWQLWILTHKSGAATDWVTRFYADYTAMERLTVGFDNLPVVVWENVDSILTQVGEFFLFGIGHESFAGHQLARLITIASIVGAVRLVMRCRRFQYAAFALVFTALMCFWHFPPDQRLFVPLVPMFIAGMWTELTNVGTMARDTYRRGRPGDKPVAIAFGAVLAVFALCVVGWTADMRLVQLPAMMANHRQDTLRIRQSFARLAASTPADAVIQSDEDVMVHLFTGRHGYRTIVPPRLFYSNQRELVRTAYAALPEAAAAPWTHVLVSENAWKHTIAGEDLEFVRKHVAGRADLTRLWSNSGDILYERKARTVARVTF